MQANPVEARVACTLAVSAEERPAVPCGRDGSDNKNEELIHGRARKWPVVVLNVLADRMKWIRAVALTAHVALSKESNF
jgi:hypothetical protein